jgi:hypothetical protein
MRARTLSVSLVSAFAVAAAALAQSPAASAATVTIRNDRDRDPAIYYVAAPGERNEISLAYGDGETTTISDSGAVITASRRCRSIDAHTAVCPALDVDVHIAVGDLDDHVTPSQSFSEDLIIDGGPGGDVLRGTDYRYGGDRLSGGGGQDQLYGGRGNDTLTDGDLAGAVGDAAPGPDTLDGGRGLEDTLSYARRTGAVQVRAGASANAGERGEHDNTLGIENIVGGAGNDRLLGDRRGNSLTGRAGNDVLVGRRGWDGLSGGAGNDVLVGHRGWDTLYGGRGEDQLSGGRDRDSLYGGAGIDALTCGGGDDEAVNPRPREVVPRSCESVGFSWDDGTRGWQARGHPRATQTWWLSLSTYCPGIWDDEIVSCHGTVAMRETRGRHRLLARGQFSHAATGSISFNVSLALTATGYRWWSGLLGRTSATISARVTAEHTPKRPFEWSIRPPPPG